MNNNGSLQNAVENSATTLKGFAKEAGKQAKHYLTEASEKAVEMKDAVEDQVKTNPFKSLGVAFASGALVGLIFGRRRK